MVIGVVVVVVDRDVVESVIDVVDVVVLLVVVVVAVVVIDIIVVVVVANVVVTVVCIDVVAAAHGALHCLGQERISVGSEHVRITHSGASCIVDMQSKY